MYGLLKVVHVVGFSLWIGGLIAMALLVMAGARNKAAGILADIGALLTLAAGVYTAVAQHFFKVPWMHVKLLLVAFFIVVHVLLRIRMRKGRPGGAGLLAAAIVLAAAIQSVAVLKPFS